MTIQIQKWGNSHGIRLSKKIIQLMGAQEGDHLRVEVKNGKLILTPTRKRRRINKKITLEKLLETMPENYQAEELDWG